MPNAFAQRIPSAVPLIEGGESMFAVGQRVWSRDGKRTGIVLECDRERVYLTQDNGAELDLAAADLTAVPPAAPAGKPTLPDGKPAATQIGHAAPSRTLTAADITPEHLRVLGVVPIRTLQAIAAVFDSRPKARKFSALGPAEKLNVIAEITAVPYRTMREYSDRPGELGLLMGKGLADSRRTSSN